ncbi:MAG TPA: hypothetical protein VFE25_08775, partial [Opitutaceae bacterium]|nr:hypothetical protein [Opitutaceae bacterium]
SPQMGALNDVTASMPHPGGAIRVSLHRKEASVTATVDLPPGLPGTFTWSGQERTLTPGSQTFSLAAPASR